jgi:hypothetical protein
VIPTLGGLPLSFIENRGQWDERARFSVRGPEMAVFFTPHSFAIDLAGRQERSTASSDRITHAGVFLTFEGADEGVVLEGVDPLPGRYNYFIGRDPSQWHTEVPSYAAIRYRGMYPGVDVRVHEQEGQLEYDLIADTSADLDAIVLRCDGAEDVCVDEHGTLVIETVVGTLEQPAPRAFEVDPLDGLVPIDCKYVLRDPRRVGFEVARRHDGRSIFIDPGLAFSRLLGGSDYDFGGVIAVDAAGSINVAGQTSTADFPTTAGA